METWYFFGQGWFGGASQVGPLLASDLGLGAVGAESWLWESVLGVLLLGAVAWGWWAYRRQRNQASIAEGLRFEERPWPALTGSVPAAALQKDEPPANSEMVLQAIEQLQKKGVSALFEHAGHLLNHPDSRVRNRILHLVGHQSSTDLLHHLALDDPDPALREEASRLTGSHPEADDLLQHPDVAVRKGAIRGRLEVAPTDAAAQASLLAAAASDETTDQLVALGLLAFLPPAQQVAVVTNGLASAQPALVEAAVAAAAAMPSATLLNQLIALLGTKAVKQPAADSLVRLGNVALPPVAEALMREIDARRLHQLAQVCGRMATPAARQVLMAVVQSENLLGRAAGLRALSHFIPEPADTPLFHRLVEQELQLAQQLLHGMAAAGTELRQALGYELQVGWQRLFGALLQVYDRPLLLAARCGAAPIAGTRLAHALQMLASVLPQPLYRGIQALLTEGPLPDRVAVLDGLLGPVASAETIQTTVIRRGAAAFSAWTIAVALRAWHPRPATVGYLHPHLQTTDALVLESARALLRQLPELRPAAYDQLLALHPSFIPSLMTTPEPASCISVLERVRMLKGTALFAETPENVLGTIVPIMRQVAFESEENIFVKGALGTSLFIVCEGEVSIRSGTRHLATFQKGDFFGELALLDAEPRSATAVAHGPVVAFRLDQEDFYEVMEERAEVLRSILRVLCQRLRRQNELSQVA